MEGIPSCYAEFSGTWDCSLECTFFPGKARNAWVSGDGLKTTQAPYLLDNVPNGVQVGSIQVPIIFAILQEFVVSNLVLHGLPVGEPVRLSVFL